MTNHSSTSSFLRRTVAGLAAAATIAVGGVSAVSPADAQAAGVRQQAYVAPASTAQVEATATTGSPKRTA